MPALHLSLCPEGFFFFSVAKISPKYVWLNDGKTALTQASLFIVYCQLLITTILTTHATKIDTNDLF